MRTNPRPDNSFQRTAIGVVRSTIVVLLLSALLPVCVLTAGEPIDLSKIDHFCPKGRVQDRVGNPHLPVVDLLIEKGTNSIPLLIEMLDDDKAIEHQIIDYWSGNSVGDIALVILTDFTTDSSWTASTIDGTSWNELLGSKPNPDILLPVYYQLQDFKLKHGSKEIKRRWQKIWSEHGQQIYWDPKERCFKLRATKKAPTHN
jgi:hypothetical protein